MMTRREFLAASATSMVIADAGNRDALGEGAAFPWYATMRRCGQINFNERDPFNLNADAWMDYWASLKVNAVLLNAGGILAFYPTEIPYHHRSQYLGSRDLFGEMVVAAKKQEIRVVARMDCNLAYEEALKAHPEWFQRNRDGSARPHNESPWLYHTCMFSSYFSEQMPAIYREINQRYPVDGFFTNGWPSTGSLDVCFCENCQKIYRDRVGGEPPEGTDATDPLYRKYYNVYMDRVVDIWKQWNAVAKERNPESVDVGNLGGGIRNVKSVKKLGDVAGWFNADHQGRSGNTVIWNCAQQGRVAKSVMKGRTITNVTGAYSNSSVTWRHVSKSAPEMTLWMAQTVASGMVPWFHWLGGSPEDNRWREIGRTFYQWLAANEMHFRNKRSMADLAVLYPQSTIAFYKSGAGQSAWAGASRAQTSEYLDGLYYALLEGRFFFDFVHQENLSVDALRPYRALLAPNAAYLSDGECEAIRQFAASGGSVMATYETSRYSEWGDVRRDFALSDLLGASVDGEVIGPEGNSYMRIEQHHAVIEGFEGTALLPGAENRIPIRPHDSSDPALTVVPHYPAYPPEMVYTRSPRTIQPAAIFRETGKSRVAYFPGDIDRTFWRSGNTDLSQLIQNTVHWLVAGRRSPVSICGEGVVEAFAWETDPGYALHLLNYTNPNMTRGFLRRFYPVGEQNLEFEVAKGRPIRKVHALRAKKDLKFEQSDQVVRFDVPSIVDYEVIALT